MVFLVNALVSIMPEVVPVSRRVRNLKVCGHVNMVSRICRCLSVFFGCCL